MHVTPDAVTVVGTAGAVTVALVCLPQGWFVAGVLLLFVLTLSDLLDGTMARHGRHLGPLGQLPRCHPRPHHRRGHLRGPRPVRCVQRPALDHRGRHPRAGHRAGDLLLEGAGRGRRAPPRTWASPSAPSGSSSLAIAALLTGFGVPYVLPGRALAARRAWAWSRSSSGCSRFGASCDRQRAPPGRRRMADAAATQPTRRAEMTDAVTEWAFATGWRDRQAAPRARRPTAPSMPPPTSCGGGVAGTSSSSSAISRASIPTRRPSELRAPEPSRPAELPALLVRRLPAARRWTPDDVNRTCDLQRKEIIDDAILAGTGIILVAQPLRQLGPHRRLGVPALRRAHHRGRAAQARGAVRAVRGLPAVPGHGRHPDRATRRSSASWRAPVRDEPDRATPRRPGHRAQRGHRRPVRRAGVVPGRSGRPGPASPARRCSPVTLWFEPWGLAGRVHERGRWCRRRAPARRRSRR